MNVKMRRSPPSKKRKADDSARRPSSGTEPWTVLDLFHDAAKQLPPDVVHLDQEKVANSLNILLDIDREKAVTIAVGILQSAAKIANLEQKKANLEQKKANLEQKNVNLEQKKANLEQKKANLVPTWPTH
jgi:chemotaxis response regulator CheB